MDEGRDHGSQIRGSGGHLTLAESMESRLPNERELVLISHLVQKSPQLMGLEYLKNLRVRPLDDGGMGSLALLPEGLVDDRRKFGEQVADVVFKDKDGTEVIATLYLDEVGRLFELDIWRTDFGELIELPAQL